MSHARNMVTMHIGTLSGLGAVFFSDLRAGQGTYEIQIVDENGALRVSGRYVGKAKAWRIQDTLNSTLHFATGERIKILIIGDPEVGQFNFDVVEGESIAICRSLV
jgi:hypothetical protein